jgi:hypothetical protein
VAHARKLAIQIGELFRCERDWFCWQTHSEALT